MPKGDRWMCGTRIQRDLASLERRQVAAPFRRQRVRRFVARRRKEKRQVPDGAQRDVGCIHTMAMRQAGLLAAFSALSLANVR